MLYIMPRLVPRHLLLFLHLFRYEFRHLFPVPPNIPLPRVSLHPMSFQAHRQSTKQNVLPQKEDDIPLPQAIKSALSSPKYISQPSEMKMSSIASPDADPLIILSQSHHKKYHHSHIVTLYNLVDTVHIPSQHIV